MEGNGEFISWLKNFPSGIFLVQFILENALKHLSA